MNTAAYPGYEYHLHLYQLLAYGSAEEKANAQKFQQQMICQYEKPDDMTIKNMTISGGDGQPMDLRIYIPGNVQKDSPVIMEVHGGAWIGGSLDIDNYRCIALATGTPAIVIGVDYRLSQPGGVHFPQPLMDCYAALNWISEHAQELGGDPKRIALHGTSAGGNLCASLALYIRDHNGPKLSLVILNCPALDIKNTYSRHQNAQYALNTLDKRDSPESIYLGGYNGTSPSYYAFPGLCRDLENLPPHYIVVGEYDTLRDDGLEYATRLLKSGVPCELQVAPRVGHGFCVVDHPLTHWIHKGICGSLRREFNMEITEF